MEHGVETSTAHRLLARLAREQAERRVPSLVAGVVRGGELVWSGARGAVDPAGAADVQYRIGSITKTFVAVCVLRLRDEGRLALTDPIGEHLPDAPAPEATIGQLLSHASGLQAETDGPWWERTPGGPWSELAGVLPDDPARLEPGARFHYSNVGYGFLGELVGKLRGTPWHEVVHEEILTPLGMDRTTPDPQEPHADGWAVHPWAPAVLPEPAHDAGAMAPAGQLWSTITDLARWAAFLAGDTAGVLDDATLEEMRRPRVLDDTPGDPWTTAYGLGLQVWNRDGRRAVGHGGSMPGFLAAVRVDVDSGDGAVVVSNTTSGLRHDLPWDLLDILADAEPVLPDEWRATGVDDAVLALTGTWYWGPTPFVLHARGDGWLELEPVGAAGRASRFRPLERDTWEGLDGYYAGERLRAVREADGAVAHLDLASFIFTRSPYDPQAPVPGGVDPGGWRGAP